MDEENTKELGNVGKKRNGADKITYSLHIYYNKILYNYNGIQCIKI